MQLYATMLQIGNIYLFFSMVPFKHKNCCQVHYYVNPFSLLFNRETNYLLTQLYFFTIFVFVCLALDSLGFGDYRADAEAVLQDCKAVAAKRRRQSTRLENLGIPEEELLRQQQELFAKVFFFVFVQDSSNKFRPGR